jgi:hypothetical protein
MTGCKDAAPGVPGNFDDLLVIELAKPLQPALLLLLGN